MMIIIIIILILIILLLIIIIDRKYFFLTFLRFSQQNRFSGDDCNISVLQKSALLGTAHKSLRKVFSVCYDLTARRYARTPVIYTAQTQDNN